MGEIVNLARERKRRERAHEAERAGENRARHGRSKAQKQRERLDAEQHERGLDGSRIAPDPAEPGPDAG